MLQAGPTRAFNNPAYDLENRTGQPVIPPPMIAASSSDDIILLSKKSRAGVSPRHPMAQPSGEYRGYVITRLLVIVTFEVENFTIHGKKLQ